MTETPNTSAEAVDAVYRMICDDVLPAFDVPSDVARADIELWDAVRASLAPLSAENAALRADVERLREAGARVVQAFDAAKDAGSPHKLSPAAALAMNALRAAITAPAPRQEKDDAN